ncbi:heavy-metal-associated domain-containing protein [Clavibacter phaseoli]|uniref:heavy-metal-associated domain-containing protein n=1 Tax=Clavibacter phaseoli TaxID=1734031 RepID=UPI001F1E7DA5|nr:heavy metal-associated domain-containing protein [Clavibacter phaseoli]UKF32443.1 heavy-metal-associated domain-containing protein [Clavibacter phaseoli]UKF38536.1 heavy-metal-associated domain-containing protein [Clavibacter phaseoli]
MTISTRPLLPMASDASACACCAAPDTAEHSAADSELASSSSQITSAFGVTGMTCAHCVSTVTQALEEIPGVDEVRVSLAAGGTSTVDVVGAGSIDPAVVAATIERAGYTLAPAS